MLSIHVVARRDLFLGLNKIINYLSISWSLASMGSPLGMSDSPNLPTMVQSPSAKRYGDLWSNGDLIKSKPKAPAGPRILLLRPTLRPQRPLMSPAGMFLLLFNCEGLLLLLCGEPLLSLGELLDSLVGDLQDDLLTDRT